jgi:asparagine synthase (glutamine-hydrolysing)
MCGICGIATKAGGPPVSSELITRMCREIIHRGPDDEGVHVEPGVGLGNRRLSIIDVEGGHQPLSNEDGTVWIAYNGEAYNFSEVRDELIGRGHAFKTRSDTETMVHAFEEWGPDRFLDRFRGMFAFALWDRKSRRLRLVRDRVGIKPLYYTRLADGSLVFGSELKTILAHPGVPREVEPVALDLFLTLEYVPAPYSIFKNIYKLPAASVLTYQDGRVDVRAYWDVAPPAAPDQRLSKRSVALLRDELYALLKESVRLRLVSDVPLGAFLSGGIDSSTIVGLMRELGASPLRTFSIGFKDASYDELGHARRIARLFETEHEELIIEPQALELTEKLVRHLDEPLGDFSIFPTFLVSRMARAHVKVALSGDGGDELFGGYEHYQAQKIARIPGVAPGAKAAGRITRRLRPSDKKKGAWNKVRRFSQAFDHDRSLRHLRWMMFLSDADKGVLYSEDLKTSLGGVQGISAREPFSNVFERLAGFDRTTGELYLDLKTYLVDDIMVKVDRMSMATSLEAREPLLDHKLVEFAFRLPGRLKLHGLTTKWIFKTTVERLLPRENIYRKKEGFSIPIKHWLRAELRGLMEDYLSEKRLAAAGFFNYGPVRIMMDAHIAGRENYSHQLWALLLFEIWHEQYLK